MPKTEICRSGKITVENGLGPGILLGLARATTKIRTENPMSEPITTREFKISDFDAAIALWTKVEGIEIAEGDTKEDVETFLARNPNLSRVVEDGGKLIGVALCGEDGRRGYIYHLAVEPSYHQKGLARRLVTECLDALRARGLKRALILVASDNPGAQAFWQRCGWEDVPGAKVMGIDL